MRSRAQPLHVPDRWPFFTVGLAGEAWVCRAPLLPGERSELVRWFGETSQAASEAFAVAGDAEASDDDRLAALRRATDAMEAAIGWVLCATWHDPARELEAATRWRDGGYVGLHARETCGRDCASEIAEALALTYEDLSAVVRRIVQVIQTPGPSRDDVREVVHFFGTPTQVGTTSP